MNVLVFLMLVGLLSSLLLTTTVTNNVFAQDEEEEDEKDKEEQQEEEDTNDEEKGSEEEESYEETKSNEDEESEESEEQQNETESIPVVEESTNESIIAEPIQQISEGWNDIANTKQELEQQKQQVLTQEQEFKEQLKSILIDINIDDTEAQPEEQIITQPQSAAPPTADLSCNCTPINGGTEKPILNLAGDHILNPEPVNTNTELQQIIIDPSDIVNYKSIGSIKNTDYVNTYNAKNVLDNNLNNLSSFSQYGKSGFLIQLKGDALNDWQVCSAEINTYNPKNVPFTLAVQAGKNYTGVLDNATENVNFDSCVNNVNKIMMYFDSVDKYTSISELKLFGKPVNSQPIPPTEPPVLEPEPKIIQIRDSNAEVSIDNSTVLLKFGQNVYKVDPDSNIVLIPN